MLTWVEYIYIREKRGYKDLFIFFFKAYTIHKQATKMYMAQEQETLTQLTVQALK